MGTFVLPTKDQGPQPWMFPSDLLTDETFVTSIQQLLLNFDYKSPVSNWETLKACIQTFCQSCTHFCFKQTKRELTALRLTLKYINKQIFNKKNLEADCLHIQSQIEQIQDSKAFFDCEDGKALH